MKGSKSFIVFIITCTQNCRRLVNKSVMQLFIYGNKNILELNLLVVIPLFYLLMFDQFRVMTAS